jgi:hypothetical protein
MPDSFLGLFRFRRVMAGRVDGREAPEFLGFAVDDGEVDIGDVIIEDENIYGDGVNVAARLEALSEPGGICVSRVVRDQVRDKGRFRL